MHQPGISTAELAQQLHVKPHAIHRRVCVKGSYFGVRPLRRLPNGRLDWPADAKAQILAFVENRAAEAEAA